LENKNSRCVETTKTKTIELSVGLQQMQMHIYIKNAHQVNIMSQQSRVQSYCSSSLQ